MTEDVVQYFRIIIGDREEPKCKRVMIQDIILKNGLAFDFSLKIKAQCFKTI